LSASSSTFRPGQDRIKTLTRLAPDNFYLSSEDYAAYASRTFASEKIFIKKLGLSAK